MITIPARARVLLATRPVDFRKGAHGLAALASQVLGADPFSGVVVVFRCKRADRTRTADKGWGDPRRIRSLTASVCEAEHKTGFGADLSPYFR